MIQVSNNSVPVVVLQLTSSLQHGGLSVARTLGRLGIPIYWAHSYSRPPAALSCYVHGALQLNPNSLAETLLENLLAFRGRIGREAILVPIDDPAALFIADYTGALEKHFLFMKRPASLLRILNSKKEMYFLCKKMGVPTPKASFPQSRDDVAAFAESAVFPVALKRIVGWLPEHRKQESMIIANSPGALLEEHKRIENPGKPNVMLQEYILGSLDSFWAFAGFFTHDSECLVAFTGKKLRQSPPFRGMTTLGICLKNETLEKMAIDFLGKVGYSGIVDMEYRYDRRDNQYKLLDINPRAGAQFRVFVDSNGMDVVRALYLYLTESLIQPGVAREGRKWIVEQSDLMTSLRYGRMGMLTFKEWAHSLRGIEEGAWFARDDLVPFAAMFWSSLLKAGRDVKDRVQLVLRNYR